MLYLLENIYKLCKLTKRIVKNLYILGVFMYHMSLFKNVLAFSLLLSPLYIFSQESGGIEEIVVTAEKREQNLQDVPSSITALSGSEMERDNFQNLMDLQTSIPSVVVGSAGASRPFLFIRGIGSRKFDPGTEGAVGVFVDEVYNTRSVSYTHHRAHET